jgi:cytochrome P450
MNVDGSRFDHHSPDWMRDPSATYAALRANCPVVHSDVHGGFWLVTRHADVHAVARDWAVYSSASGIAVPAALDTRVVPQEADPPLHTVVRDQIVPWFSPGRVAEMEPLVRDLAVRLYEAAMAGGSFDLAIDVAIPLASLTMLRLLGFPEAVEPILQADIEALLRTRHDPTALAAAAERFAATMFAEISARREGTPGGRDDLLEKILQMTVAGAPIDDPTAISVGMSLIFAGLETSANAITTAAHVLATEPAARDRLLADPSLLPAAVEELLRIASPVECIGRRVTTATTLAGTALAAGERVLISYGSANHDPEVFDDPEHVVLDRPHNHHLAFGTGIHRCIGRHLARLELRVGLGELLARAPGYRIVGEPAWGFGENRGIRSLPLAVR